MLIGVVVVVVSVSVMMVENAKKLRAQEQEFIVQEEQLQKQIDEEKERTEKLEEEKKHVKTDEYIREVARDKLGLIDPGEILFREEGK